MKRPFSCSSGTVLAPTSNIDWRSPPIIWWATADRGPRYATLPSMPSGTIMSSLSTSAWK